MIEAKRGERYRHLKTDGTYRVRAIARAEATLERVVVYEKIDPQTWNPIEPRADNTWTRPAAEFGDGRFVMVGARDALQKATP